MSDASDAEAKQKIAALVKDIDYAVLATRAPGDGTMHARPMACRAAEADGTFWFFSKLDSRKVKDLRADPSTLLSFADPRAQNFVTVAGKGRIVEDRAVVKEKWSEIYRAWFPNGPDDPNVILIRVEAEHAEYWDNPTSAVVYAFGYVKAAVTGKPARSGEVGTAEFT